MSSFELWFGLGAAALCLGLAAYAPYKARRDRLSASSMSIADEAQFYQALQPGLSYRYRFYTIQDDFGGSRFTLENAEREKLIEAERMNFGGGIRLGDLKLRIDSYLPGMKMKPTGQRAESLEAFLYKPDGQLWLQLTAKVSGGHKLYTFLYQQATYTLEWKPAQGLWGSFGLESWPAELRRNGELLAQLIRRDTKGWLADFSNIIMFACREPPPPDLLGLAGLICCTNFFPKHR
jgi:hypothetical protein